MNTYLLNALSILIMGSIFSCNSNIIRIPPSPYPISEDKFSIDTIAEGFTIPYGIAIVSDEEFYVTDRIGSLFHLKNGQKREIKGMPKVATFGVPGIKAILHGGLMDISLHPNYPQAPWIYLSYLSLEGHSTVLRFQIEENTAVKIDTIFKARKQDYTGNGMRIVWEDSTHFFLNIGNSMLSTSENPIAFAQDLDHDAGKIHRLMEDGSIPEDNPVLASSNKSSSIWSFGHRDVQGLIIDEDSGELIGVEHGPKGGDEFNVIEKGKNYGWPLFSNGINYDGAWVSTISEDSAATFTVFPEHYWTVPTRNGGQAIAPACLFKARDSNVSDWNDFFLIGSLAYRRLMKYDRKSKETFGLDIEGRVRTIKQLPGGDIIALIERSDLRKTDGMIVRIGK